MQQLSSMTLILKPASTLDAAQRLGSVGPSLQGALMEKVDSEYAALLHQLPFNPYSQYGQWQGDRLVWRVNALTSEAEEHIIEPLRSLDSITLKSVRTTFDIEKTSLETASLQTLLKEINQPGPDKVRVRFVTPTSFKSQGSYVIMPSVRLILQNLLMHYGQVYDSNKDGYDETIEYVDRHVRVLAYDLRSQYFGRVARGQQRIPAFVGSMTLGLRGPATASGLVRMLLRFGGFAGVGIKTSMGMGGFVCCE